MAAPWAAWFNGGKIVRVEAVATWDRLVAAPAAARMSAAASLALWTGVVTCGRLLAYL